MQLKSTGLLSVLTFSEKRKDLLFLLEEGPRSLSQIREYFDVSSPEISPRLKEMEAANLIIKDEKEYHITPIGKVAAKYLNPLVNTLESIEKNEDFWKDHILEGIPQHLLDRISELGECIVHEESLENIYDSHKKFLDNIARSKEVCGVSSIFIPIYPEFFANLAKNNVPTSLILTRNVFEKVKNEYTETMQAYLDSDNTRLYLIESAKVAFVTTDDFFSLSLFFKNGTYDPQRDLMGTGNTISNWGKELFEYYKREAREITSL
ncbi:winged helix-turn-helix domain-containing protein [Methanococcoides methylutens]|uniref:Transcriptional regulator, ArsR family n=1 Tax=Methanococcoides methylutens MM1 TaxID=1434104 RepID=A0A0E3WZA5_METMT|nr:Transcriptional regulator, ArsR family [Methanococcoides methylutens MM1]